MSEEITRQLPGDVLKLILARFDSMDKRFDSVDARFDSVDQRFDSVGKRFDSVEARLDSLDGRLTTVEEKVDRRLQETRPIWERALAEIAGLRAEMQEGFERIRGEMNHGLRRVERQVDILNHNILEVRGDLRYLDDRLTKLESEPAQ
jgi:chromosome segregation ATPase